MEHLRDFVLERVLSDDARSKTVALLGRFEGRAGQAVLLLARQHFDCAAIGALPAQLTALQPLFANDVYSKATGQVPAEQGAVVLDLIFPATEKHISKHSTQRTLLVTETPADYAAITCPFIAAIPPARLQWVYNILEGKAEAERVVFADHDPETGFLLVPDQKWDGKQTEQMYLQAIVMRRDVGSLRDLTAAHLPLLRNVRDGCRRAARTAYNVGPAELRLWLHYMPSYFHLHVHAAHTRWDGYGLQAGKAVLLDDVIDCLACFSSDCWARRTLTFSLGERDPLLAAFRQAGVGAAQPAAPQAD